MFTSKGSASRIGSKRPGTTSSAKTKKTIKEARDFQEETTTADIRGLGNISGNPAGDISNYASDNIATADTLNDVLKKFINTWHSKYHLTKVKK